jgi:hypothetical protein
VKKAEGRRQRAEVVRAALVCVAILAMPVIASACPVCFGQTATPLTKGANNGILFLLGIIGSVQVGFVALFVSFWRRTKALQERREQFRVLDGGQS